MHYFMRLIGDEAQAVKPIVRIASLYENGSTVEVPVQHHPSVFVLPGVEGLYIIFSFRKFKSIQFCPTFNYPFWFALFLGVAAVMEPLAAALNLQVLCLQYTYDNPPPTIKELVKTLIIVSSFSFCQWPTAVRGTMEFILSWTVSAHNQSSSQGTGIPPNWLFIRRLSCHGGG